MHPVGRMRSTRLDEPHLREDQSPALGNYHRNFWNRNEQSGFFKRPQQRPILSPRTNILYRQPLLKPLTDRFGVSSTGAIDSDSRHPFNCDILLLHSGEKSKAPKKEIRGEDNPGSRKVVL